ncbi:MAG: 2,3,4,5-tetrahydropyridine-2,6-dicarboxylate N-succinyltransferase [Planctomycetes bacterium]|nr:2,3,4,5-tetrahydropyridine-2,6-dicarboxylate N-succinyltransferase [Planctomycetota bacterium]MCB9903585.1 2,3,4,5-tetrahydropyridine-2,6-dicarboxylate N-succinyltransferase [Planctomycetota bacterium]
MRGAELLDALEAGIVRVAERTASGDWIVNTWVKDAILQLFRTSSIVPKGLEGEPGLFRDKQPLDVRRFDAASNVRIVPGGSAVRRGAHLGPGVVCMPPMYVNLGAFVGAGTMVDSHALIGSCAQIGERVHVSAAAQIGGVLEPPGARPVIIEDGAFIGGGAGIYEGVLIRRGAVIAGGLQLTASTPVFDLVHERELRGTRAAPLEIPANAVVLPGTRPVSSQWGRERGLNQACALIVKYRDEKTDQGTALEEALR